MSTPNNQLSADTVIEKFGGIRPLASKLGIAFTTVQGWKKRNSIPDRHWKRIYKLAQDEGIDIKGGGAAPASKPAPVAAKPAAVSAPLAASVPPRAETIHAPEPVVVREKTVVKGYSMAQGILVTCVSVTLSLGLLVVLFGPDIFVSNPNDRIAALEDKVNKGSGGGQYQDLASTQMQLSDTINNRVMPRLNEMSALMGSLGNPQSLADLSASLKNLQETAEGQAQLNMAVSELKDIVSGLQGEVTNLDGALASAQKENGALAETIGKVSATDLTAAAMLLALNQFRNSLDRQEPLEGDIALLRSVVNPDENPELAESIDRMEPFAASGIMSAEGLSTELKAAGNDIVEARLRGDNASMADILKARLQNVLNIKKDGVPVMGTDEQKLVAKAQQQLKAGDVAGAKATLEQLPGQSRAVAQPIIEKANQNLLARQVESQITRFFAQSLQGLRTGTGSGNVYNTPVPYVAPPRVGIAPVTPEEAPEILRTKPMTPPVAATPAAPTGKSSTANPADEPAPIPNLRGKTPTANLDESALDQPEGASPAPTSSDL